MMKINLRSGKTLDAEKIETGQHAYKLLDRNGDVMNHLGKPLVESIESV
jgi:hypothetical protein